MPKKNSTPNPKSPNIVNVKNTVGHDRFDDVFTEYQPDVVVKAGIIEDTIFFKTENAILLRVKVLTERIIRFTYTFQHTFEADFSYAIDDKFVGQGVAFSFSEATDFYHLSTDCLRVNISKNGLKVTIFDENNVLISQDTEGFTARTTLVHGTTEVKITKATDKNEAFFGLGDKSCSLNLRGQKLQNWNTDAFAFEADTDPLYRAIPFFFGLKKGVGYGIFFDNPFKTHFDFAKTKKNQISFSADGGQVDYYFIHGPSLTEVAQQYTDLTGRPELPPLWSLGFHQCRWSYFPESRVREVANKFRAMQIPCDAIYFDIDYMDGFRCFTWNKKYFPDPKTLIADLKLQGFQSVVMIDPGIKKDDEYWLYTEGVAKDFYLKRADGDLMFGQVWPGECVYPDFTHPAVRHWWGQLYEGLYNDENVAGFWNDMNEPANFKVWHKTIPDDVRHDYEGLLSSHKKAHNIYGMQMSRATTEGLKRLQPTKRPFLVTRASYAGGQRFAAVWTGDNLATWEHLQIANRQIQRLSISGFSHCGSDIGGFMQEPTGELMVRWLQMGIFHPFYRIHSAGNNEAGDSLTDETTMLESLEKRRLDQEPWSFGEPFTALGKAAIELRYQLLPYIYTTMMQHVNTGIPVIQSLIFYDQNDKNLLGVEREFTFGQHILVSPVIEEGSKNQTLYLPKGDWFDFYNGKKYVGGKNITVETPLSKMPIFIKSGAVIPIYPVMQFTNERAIEVLDLKVFYTKETEYSELYEDSGDGYGYRLGEFSLSFFEVKGTPKSLILSKNTEGSFETSYETIRLVFVGLPFKIKAIRVDGKGFDYKNVEMGVEIIVDKRFEKIEIAG